MRLRALTYACAVTLVAASALIGVASPSAAQQVTAVDCGSTTYRWLFWPDGHGALTSVPHPATNLPHLDVYAGKGKKFLESQNVGYADGATVTTGATCTPAALPGGGSVSVKSTTQTTQLACSFASKPVFVSVPESTVDAPSLNAVVGSALMVSAQLGEPGTGSTLDYNAKFCKPAKAPK